MRLLERVRVLKRQAEENSRKYAEYESLKARADVYGNYAMELAIILELHAKSDEALLRKVLGNVVQLHRSWAEDYADERQIAQAHTYIADSLQAALDGIEGDLTLTVQNEPKPKRARKGKKRDDVLN